MLVLGFQGRISALGMLEAFSTWNKAPGSGKVIQKDLYLRFGTIGALMIGVGLWSSTSA